MASQDSSNIQESATALLEGLPYIQAFQGKTIVIKYGGNAMQSESLQLAFCRDVVFMKSVGLVPVVVHGGGPQISVAIEQAGLSTRFVHGLRITDRKTMDVVEDVVMNQINRALVQMIKQQGGSAIGLGPDVDGGLLQAKKLDDSVVDPETGLPLDYGFVGKVEEVAIEKLAIDCVDSPIPVIAPIGIDANGESYNINADTVAAAVAESVRAEKLVLLTNMPGIMDREATLISALTIDQLDELIETEVIVGGMLPKARCAQHALQAKVLER